MEKVAPSLFSRRAILALLAVLYAVGGIMSACKIVERTQASTGATEEILKLYSLQNEGAVALQRFDKDHPLLGTFFSSTISQTMKLSSAGQAEDNLHGEVTRLLKVVRHDSFSAAWWSWFLVSLSALYAVTVIALERSFTTRPVLFALTCVSVILFFIGVIAPAMVIWTAPSIPMQSGTLNFVVQHQVRGIGAIIWELLTTDHWVIGGFLLLFSILTPLTKASLTFFITASSSRDLNRRIGQFLHAIGKWSMADVFVAAILLALYALKAQEATKSIPCLGLYYFTGYCLLSLTTTELLVHSEATEGESKRKRGKRLGLGVIGGLAAGLICFVAMSSLYTYQQYTMNTKERIKGASVPGLLDGADLVLPVHKE